MRNRCKQIPKAFLHHKVFRIRVNVLDITQEEMVHRLALSSQSYVDPERGKTSYSAVTLTLLVVYVCNTPTEFLDELQYAFETVRTKAY